MKQQGETKNMIIAPLLLVSLVESCFERFLFTPTQQLDLSIDIKTENGEMYFLVECKSNSENEQAQKNDNNKLTKSIKRLELLYPGKHSFDVYSENGITNLLLVLEAVETSLVIENEKEELVVL